MATTSPDNIRTPNSGDQYALVQDMGILADTVQNALIKRANAYVGTVAQRTAFESSAPTGTIWSDTDGDRLVWKKGATDWEPVTPPVNDTGWVDCVTGPGNTRQVQVRRIGDQVVFSGEIEYSSGWPANTSGRLAFTLPDSSFRPKEYIRAALGGYGSPNANQVNAIFTANTDTVVAFQAGANFQIAYFGSVSYMAA